MVSAHFITTLNSKYYSWASVDSCSNMRLSSYRQIISRQLEYNVITCMVLNKLIKLLYRIDSCMLVLTFIFMWFIWQMYSLISKSMMDRIMFILNCIRRGCCRRKWGLLRWRRFSPLWWYPLVRLIRPFCIWKLHQRRVSSRCMLFQLLMGLVPDANYHWNRYLYREMTIMCMLMDMSHRISGCFLTGQEGLSFNLTNTALARTYSTTFYCTITRSNSSTRYVKLTTNLASFHTSHLIIQINMITFYLIINKNQRTTRTYPQVISHEHLVLGIGW